MITSTRYRARQTRKVGQPITVDILPDARATIERYVMDNTAVDHKEYGGWLLGSSKRTPNSAMISAATGMGAGDNRDYKRCDMWATTGMAEAEVLGLEFLGRWHTHPYNDRTNLSTVDLRSGAQLLAGDGKFIDLLVTPGLSQRWSLAQATAYAYERVDGKVKYHTATLHGWDY